MNTIELLNKPVSVSETVATLQSMIVEGEVDALSAWINLSRMAKVIEDVKKSPRVRDAALGVFSRYGQRSTVIGDCTVEEKEAGVKYDFSECGDAVLANLTTQRAELDCRIKEREKMLKALPGKTVMVDEATGEVLTLSPPFKTSKTTLQITFKK